jgi:micrococcal nuclease
MYEYKAQVLRVVDGDTVDFLVDLGFMVHVKVRARLVGVNTPEVYGVKKDSDEYAAGQVASQVTRLWFVNNCPDGTCVIRTQKTGKYGRWIAEVFPTKDLEPSLNQHLIEKGYVG